MADGAAAGMFDAEEPADEFDARDPFDDDVDEEEVRSSTAAALDSAMAYSESVDAERRDNLDRYLGRPYGTEMENYSQHIDRSALETVGWILPALLEIFHGSDEVGEFDPQNQDDVQGAEQATDYINLIYNRDNPGFLISSAVILDGLVERLGVFKTTWKEEAKVSMSRHDGLSEDEALMLLAEPGVELLAIREREPDKALAALLPGPSYDLKIRRVSKKAGVSIEAVPPEEYGYIEAPRPDLIPFHCHERQMARADLIALGYEADTVNALPSDEMSDAQTAGKRWDARTGWSGESSATHDSMRLVTVAECYIRADFDGDGYAEWRKVVLGGSGRELLSQEMIDEPPFDPMTPILLSHRIEGLSVVDLVKDLQALRTDLIRQMIDGLFEVNTPRPKVKLTAHKSTWEAVLKPAPGKPIPVNNMDDVMWDQPAWQGAQALPFLEYLDRAREARSGVSPASTGTNPDMLNGAAQATVAQLMSAAQQKVGLIARVLAETGFKSLFRRILRLVVKHQDKPRVVRLRGRWTPMDPRHWNADMDYIPNVGLGTGDKAKVREALMATLALQKEAMANGLDNMAGPKQIYNTLKDLVKASGLKSADPYWNDPEQNPKPPSPAPDPMAEPMAAAAIGAEKVKQETALTKARMDDDFRRDELAVDTAMEAARLGQELDMEALKAETNAPRGPDGALLPPGQGALGAPPAPVEGEPGPPMTPRGMF